MNSLVLLIWTIPKILSNKIRASARVFFLNRTLFLIFLFFWLKNQCMLINFKQNSTQSTNWNSSLTSLLKGNNWLVFILSLNIHVHVKSVYKSRLFIHLQVLLIYYRYNSTSAASTTDYLSMLSVSVLYMVSFYYSNENFKLRKSSVRY